MSLLLLLLGFPRLIHALPRPNSIQTYPPLLLVSARFIAASLAFFFLLLLDFLDGFFGEFLPVHALEDVLLAGALVAEPDEQTGGGVAGDGAAENDRGNGKGAVLVVDAPCACAERDLEERVAVEEHDDGDEEAERERVVGFGLVGFVEGVGFTKLVLVVFELLLLLGRQDGKLPLLLWVGGVGCSGSRYGGVFCREVVMVG